MDIIFRKFRGCVATPPEPGEIHIRAHAAEHGDRRDFASLVLEHGIGVFAAGPGDVQRIVVDEDPTLDDLLAASFTARLLTSQKLPDGCKAFARYAALVREGLKPSDVPLETSLEGIYLALRNWHGSNLTEAAPGAKFVADWSRMAAKIFRAAESDVDPFTTSLFATGPEFARERAFLTKDHEVFRQDVLRGEQWTVQIPGGPPQALALILRQPRSLLFKFWSRRDEESRSRAFLLLGVSTSADQWIFSTDPIQRLSLKPLADVLQAAEIAQDPDRAQGDFWFDGKPFGHTLIAAPRGGTVLSDEKVLSIVRQWSKARPVGLRVLGRKTALMGTAAAILLFAAGLTAHHLFPGFPGGGDDKKVRHRDLGDEIDRETGLPVGQAVKGNLHLLAVGVSKYANKKYDLKYACPDAEGVARVFKESEAGPFKKIFRTLLVDEQATRREIIKALAGLKKDVTQNDLVIVTLAGHGANYEGEDFYFLPHDYVDTSTVVFWADFARYLGNLPCHVLVVLDTCHSGTATKQLRGPKEQEKILTVQNPGRGMVVMAACLGGSSAQETDACGHGALTMAVLEGLSGAYLCASKDTAPLPKGIVLSGSEEKVITLYELNYYVTNRVRELVGGDQAVVTNHTGNIDLSKIRLAIASGK